MAERLLSMLTEPLFTLGDNEMTPLRLLAICAVLIIVFWGSKFAERMLRRLADRRTQHFSRSAAYAFARIIRYSLLVIGLLIGLSWAGFDIRSLAIVGGAIGIGVGLGLQPMVANFVSGLVLLLDRSLKVGDFVDLQSGVRGHVVEIAMRYTRVHTNDSVDVLVPNAEFINGRVTNWTFDELSRRLHVPFSAAYGSDKKLVREAGIAAARHVDGVVIEGDRRLPNVWLVGFGDSGLNFELVVWVNHDLATHPGSTQARLLWALDDELRARDIEIPFPQRDLRWRTGPLHVELSRRQGP